ncbi:hypothetical protein E4T38_09059 [Aureobasidium subglaciale]|nr:hypothetical protein E4T38_09059 [Aureobasidium subglaciale]
MSHAVGVAVAYHSTFDGPIPKAIAVVRSFDLLFLCIDKMADRSNYNRGQEDEEDEEDIDETVFALVCLE